MTPSGEIASQVRALGVSAGDVLLVHASLRAIRPEGGPAGLIAALREAIGPEGTLVMPSWTGDEDLPFDPRRTRAAPDLGAAADAFWRMPGVVRSEHAEAFAALGPRAAEILRDPLPLPPHIPASPVGRVHDLDGKILLLGVGHDANTTLHLAELVFDVPYRLRKSVTVMKNGAVVKLEYGENDHCCECFRQMDGWLRARGLQSEGPVGDGIGRLMRSRDVVRVAVEQLRADPLAFLHQTDAGCATCNEARASMVKRR